jgi:DNA-binding response OmpR family regulator
MLYTRSDRSFRPRSRGDDRRWVLTGPMSAGAAHIFVVDDEADARAMVGDYLRMHGFEVTLCDGGRTLRAAIAQRAPDLVVLDLNMPEEDGLSIVRDLKAHSAIPIIMLTATASAIDRVVGLELGADDYLPKPCELRELVARARSVLRRVQATAVSAPAEPPAALAPEAARRVRFGTKWLELDAVRLRDERGEEQALTRSEFDLLKAFADNPKRALSRERLLDLADARDPDAFDRAIDVRINRIRKKIEPDPANPRFIRTVRGLGYVFRPDGD